MSQATNDSVLEDSLKSARDTAQSFVLNIEGFEGPIDVLLHLARDQKVDLAEISILALVEQYLEFIRTARDLKLEIAADFLVMAAWLTFMKSKILAPDPEDESPDDGLSGSQMAAALALQLRHIEAMRSCGNKLLEREQLGKNFFAVGQPFSLGKITHSQYECTLHELLTAYGLHRRRQGQASMALNRQEIYSFDAALTRMRGFMKDPRLKNWSDLTSFLPDDIQGAIGKKSSIASILLASLEMARQGTLELKQDEAFGPIMLRVPEHKTRD